MMESHVLFSNEVVLDDERIMKLDYSLTVGVTKASQNLPYYGIRVTRFLDNLVESDEVTGVSESREDVISIIKKLCQFQVTPISMIEIVDELVTLGA